MTLDLKTASDATLFSPETPEERARRVTREARILAQAEREIEAGLGFDDEEMEARFAEWDRLDPIDECPPGPAPRS